MRDPLYICIILILCALCMLCLKTTMTERNRTYQQFQSGECWIEAESNDVICIKYVEEK